MLEIILEPLILTVAGAAQAEPGRLAMTVYRASPRDPAGNETNHAPRADPLADRRSIESTVQRLEALRVVHPWERAEGDGTELWYLTAVDADLSYTIAYLPNPTAVVLIALAVASAGQSLL